MSTTRPLTPSALRTLELVTDFWPRSRFSEGQIALLAGDVSGMRLEPAQVDAALKALARREPRATIPGILAALRAAANPAQTRDTTPRRPDAPATYAELREPLRAELAERIFAFGVTAIEGALMPRAPGDQRSTRDRVLDMSGFGAGLLADKLERLTT